MAKELPYFKFEPDAWDHGNIQMCSRESKGLFADMLSFYWSRLGELPYALALQKLCNGNRDAMQELLDNEIILIDDNKIVIEFLDEQLQEFIGTNLKRKQAAEKRWHAKAMQVHCKSNAIREEKRREEKRIYISDENLNSLFIHFLEMRKKIKKPATEKAIELLLKKLEKLSGGAAEIKKQIIEQSIRSSWQDLYELKQQNNAKTTSANQQSIRTGKDYEKSKNSF